MQYVENISTPFIFTPSVLITTAMFFYFLKMIFALFNSNKNPFYFLVNLPENFNVSQENFYIENKKINLIQIAYQTNENKYIYYLNQKKYTGDNLVIINDKIFTLDEYFTQDIIFEGVQVKLFGFYADEGYIYYKNNLIKVYMWLNECLNIYEWGYYDPRPKLYVENIDQN